MTPAAASAKRLLRNAPPTLDRSVEMPCVRPLFWRDERRHMLGLWAGDLPSVLSPQREDPQVRHVAVSSLPCGEPRHARQKGIARVMRSTGPVTPRSHPRGPAGRAAPVKRSRMGAGGRFLLPQAIAGLVAIGVLGGCLAAPRHDPVTAGEWPSYGNDVGGTRYSPLGQIDRGNVERLRVAWTYRTGEVGSASPEGFGFTAFEATPLMIDGTLYFSTPYNRVIALDAETGRERWRYDP